VPSDLDALPTERPDLDKPQRVRADFCWASLVASSVHPVKVAIVEALLWLHAPLSATELTRLFEHDDYSLNSVLHHLKELVRWEVIEATGTRDARGARERFYFFR
jgi:Helix-turn-helix domain